MKEVKFGYAIGYNSIAEIVRQGVMAEKYGFKSIWFPDHFVSTQRTVICPEAWTTLTVLGMKTKRAMLALGVTDISRRHPATTAQIVATLDRLLNGRIALGIGAGEAMNTIPFGIELCKQVKKLGEAIEYTKLLWSATPKEPANYDGMFYRLTDAYLTINPVQTPHPPIYIGALGPRTRELVGELADGWYPGITSPEVYEKDLKDIERGCKKVGRNLGEIDATASVYTACSDDHVKMKSKAEWAARAKRLLILERRVLKQLSNEVSVPNNITIQKVIPSKESESFIMDAIKKVPKDAVEAIGAFGTIEECIDKIERYVKAGASHIVIRNVGSDKTLKNYGDIISYFEER